MRNKLANIEDFLEYSQTASGNISLNCIIYKHVYVRSFETLLEPWIFMWIYDVSEFKYPFDIIRRPKIFVENRFHRVSKICVLERTFNAPVAAYNEMSIVDGFLVSQK